MSDQLPNKTFHLQVVRKNNPGTPHNYNVVTKHEMKKKKEI